MQRDFIENDSWAITDVARESDAPNITEQEGVGKGENHHQAEYSNLYPRLALSTPFL